MVMTQCSSNISPTRMARFMTLTLQEDDPEFAYMFDARSDNRSIVEQYFPQLPSTSTFQKRSERDLLHILVNNMFNSRLSMSPRNHRFIYSASGGNRLFFGFDLKVNIF